MIFFTNAILVQVRGERSLLPHFGHFPLFMFSFLSWIRDHNPPRVDDKTGTGQATPGFQSLRVDGRLPPRSRS
jgi:hypothetical protein